MLSQAVVNLHMTDFQVQNFTDGSFMVYAFDNAGNQVNMSQCTTDLLHGALSLPLISVM